MKQKTKSLTASGITLIALVVTIIVLLILAGVALSLISGSDGILNQATTSADQTEFAIIQEDVDLALGTMKSQYYEARYVNGESVETSFPAYARAQMTSGYETAKGAILTIDAGTTVTYTKNNGETAPGTFDEDTGAVIMAGTVSYVEPAPQVTKYTISYNSNGGTGTMSSTKGDENSTVPLKTNSFTKTGLVFDCWKDENNNTYSDGEAITLSENLNLTAQWRTLNLGETATGENKIFTDTAGTTVTIPKNFTVSGISSEATVAGGLVVYDLEGNTVSNWNSDSDSNSILDVQENYNQFVWIPLSGTLTRYEGYEQGSLQSRLSSCSEPYTSGYSTEISEYNAMKNSVESNHGFYMARYEASQGSNGKVESKKGKTVWNYIDWGDSLVDVGTTGAVYQSQQMYKNKNGYNVTSTLVYSAQWDTMCVFIDPKYATSSCDNDSVLFDSSGYGNYNGRGNSPDPFVTGVSELKNLYDIVANAWEYTMEYWVKDDGTVLRVVRGGYAGSNGWTQPLSIRGGSRGTGEIYYGFRPALYL